MSETIFQSAQLLTEEFVIHVYADDEDTLEQLEEAKGPGRPLAGKYYYRVDRPPPESGQIHVHVYAKNNHIFAINKDGSAHDASHGFTIPNKAASALRRRFPDWKIPDNNLIESCNALSLKTLLLELNAHD